MIEDFFPTFFQKYQNRLTKRSGMPSANALWLDDVRWKFARPICAIYKYFPYFGFILLSGFCLPSPPLTQVIGRLLRMELHL